MVDGGSPSGSTQAAQPANTHDEGQALESDASASAAVASAQSQQPADEAQYKATDQAEPKPEVQDDSGREGLLGRLQSRISMSLSLFSSAEQTTKPFKRTKSSLESTQSLCVNAEPKEKEQQEGVRSPALDALMPFVPLMLRQDLLRPEPTFAAMQEPCMRTHQGAVMIADITGFTALTEDLGRRGASGVELLTRCMNNYFTLVIELVYSHGGDVMRFAGDSVICAFLPTPEEAEAEDKGLAAATLRSVKCAAVLADDLGSMRMLMDGRVVALPEQERRAMRSATAAKRAQQEAPLEAQRATQGMLRARHFLQRATADAQPGSPWQGMRSSAPTSESGQLPVPDGEASPLKQRRARSTKHTASPRITTEADTETSMCAQLASSADSHTSSNCNSTDDSSRDSPKAARRLGALFGSFTRSFSGDDLPKDSPKSPRRHSLNAHQTDAAALQKESILESTGRKEAVRCRSVGSSSHSESRQRLVSLAVRRRKTAGDVPHYPPLRSMTHSSGDLLRQRLWSEGNSSSRRHSRLGTPRRTDSHSRLGMQRDALRLSEVAPISLTGKPDKAKQRPHISCGSPAAPAEPSQESTPRIPSFTLSMPKEVTTTLLDVGRQASMGRRAKAALASGESQPLDAFFKTQSIAAHRPPHIPALRMLPGLATPESSDSLSFATRMPHLPAIQPISERSSFEIDEVPGDSQRLSSVLSSMPRSALQRELSPMMAQRMQGMSMGSDRQSGQASSPTGSSGWSLGTAEDRQLRSQLRAMFKDLLNVRRAERVAAAKAALRAELDRQPATANGPEKDPQMGLLRELIAGNEDELWLAGGTSTADSEALKQQLPASPKAAPDSTSPVIVLPPGPVAESIEADDGASYRLHAEAAASAEAPRETRDEAQIVLESTPPAAEDGFASPQPSMEAPRSGGRASIGSALWDAGQSFRGSSESVRGSVRWRSFHNSSREGGNQPRKRRWSVLLTGRRKGDRRFSLPTRRMQKRITGDLMLRDRRWSSIFAKGALPQQRQDPFSIVAQLDAATKAASASHLWQAKSPPKMQQPLNTLSLKVAVGCGTICTFHVGGAPDDGESCCARWEFFIGDRPHCAGLSIGESSTERQPMDQIASIERFLDPGEVAISSEVARQVSGMWDLLPLPWSGYRLLVPLAPAQPQSQLPCKATEGTTAGIAEHSGLSRAVVERAEGVLRAHLPDGVSARIEAGLVEFISEIRVCTILFIGFPSLKAAIMAVQKCMQQLAGSFLQFRCDEKGFLSICAFGLPGRAHEDDPARGVRAALDLVEALRFLKGEAVVGVTTGQLLCACVGSAIRSEYTVYGNAINLAARLMGKAAGSSGSLGSVLCDSTTVQLAPKAATYNCLKPQQVKGKRHPVTVYEALSPMVGEELPDGTQLRASIGTADRYSRPGGAAGVPRSVQGPPVDLHTPLIGADLMMTQVNERVAYLVDFCEGGCILVEGEAGMGKSRMLEEIQRSNLDSRSEAVTIVRAAASAAYRSQVMYPWRRVFKSLFAHDRSRGTQYTLREKDAKGRPMQVTRLGMRLAECGCEWLEWRNSLSVLLEVLEDEMPVLPAAQQEPAQENATAGCGDDSEAEDSLKENMPLRLGSPSMSMPAMSLPAMLPESAKSVAIPGPSVGSPFAAYAEALPEDAVSLVQVKAWEAASLTKSLSEGTAQGFRESSRTSLDLKTAERHEGAASVPIDPPDFIKAKAGRMMSRLNSKMVQYMSSMRNQSPEQAASAPMDVDKMPWLWRCHDDSTPASSQQGSQRCLTRHRRTPKSAGCWQRRSRREGAVQATARLQASSGMLTKHTSLASLASSLRSEELSRRALNRRTHTAGSSSHNGLDADLYGLCQHSMRSRQTSQDTHPSSASSFVNFMSSDSSAYNSVTSRAAAGSPSPIAADMPGCRGPQIKRTPSSEGSQGAVGGLIIRAHHDQASASRPRSLSRTGHAQGAGSYFPLSLSRSPSGKLTSASSASSISTAHAEGSRAIARSRSGPLICDTKNEHVGAQTLQSRQRSSFQHTYDSSGLISAGLDSHTRQALIPIRSGEVELFVRHQMQRPSPALPPSVPEAGADQNSGREVTDANSDACCSIDPGQDTKERVMRVTCASKASMRPKQRVSAVLNAFRRACSVEIPAGVPKRPSTTLSKADSTSILGLRPVTSGPPDFDTLCDAAIAAVRAPTTQAKAPPDAKSGKAARRSGKRSIFGAKRTVAPCAKLAAQEATGQAGAGAERSRQQSAPPGLPEAESMLPKAALQELRRKALARLATSNAWQGSEEESGLASAKRGAASVPLEGLKGAFPGMRVQNLRVKSTSLAHSLPSRQPAAATGAHNVTQRQKLHVPPALKALKLQELLITILREWTRAYGPLLLLLDDFDRADALSWSFLARCAEEVDTAVLVVAAIRPNDGVFAMPSLGHVAKTAVHAKVSALCTDIRQNPFTLRLVMQPFTPEQTHAFLAAALEGVHVSVEVASNLWEKTGGLPLYIEQMVVYMQQQHSANGLDALDDLSAFIRSTVTIHSLITDRIDKLQPSQQLTLKIASVMGMSVSVGLLQATYPIAATAEALERDLLELERANFLRPTDIPGTWLMTQVLARDVAYELIPFSQRRSLHAQLAKALEDDISADLMPPSTVAYHWTHSCAGTEATHWRRALHAVDWWEKAAQTAVEEGIDPAEAIGLFQRADEIAGILKAAYRSRSGTGQTPRGHSVSSRFSFGAARRAAPSAHSGLSSGSSYGPGAMLDWSSRQVHPVRRAHWHRCMASLHLAQGGLDTARLHGLQALHYMGAPLPADAPGTGSLLASCVGLVQYLSVGGCLGGGFGQRRVSNSGSSASDASIYNDMAAWIADSLHWPGQENEAGETPTAGVDWGRRKLQEAAAVLELLVNASLVLSPIDADALRYVCKTARLLQGVTFVKRFPQDSPLLPVVKKCKSVLTKTGAGPRAMRWSQLD